MRSSISGGDPTATPDAVAVLLLPPRFRAAILGHMQRELPSEGVRLLAVTPNSPCPSIVAAAAFYPGTNQDRSAIRYTMRPDEVAAALRGMARRGLRLGAVVHSHPHTVPTPSATDLAEAIGPRVLHVIVGLTPAPEIRAWQSEWSPAGVRAGYREVRIVESVSEEALWAGEDAARPHEREAWQRQ